MKSEKAALGPFEGISLFWLTIALGLGTFIQVLDGSIANVALPTIAGSLGSSAETSIWIVTSFSAMNALVLPLTGWLTQRFGGVHLFVTCTLLFSAASWLCALAPNIVALVLFRALQGAVAGSLVPLSQSLLLLHYPKEKAGMALAFWSMIVVLAPILGPVLGGWITDNYGWSWIFLINVPLGAISAWMTWSLLKDRDNRKHILPLDCIGFFLLFAAVVSLQILLDRGESLGWFSSSFLCLLGLVSVLSFLAFGFWQKRCSSPLVDLSFFSRPIFLLGLLASSIGFLLFSGSGVLLPLWLQKYNGYTAYWAGVAIASSGLFPLVLSPLIGRLLTKIDMRIFPAIGFLFFSATFFWLSALNTEVSIGQIAQRRLFQGLGVAFFFMPLVKISFSDIASEELSSASGLFNFVRILSGGGLGTSLFLAAFQKRLFWHQSYLTESLLYPLAYSSDLYPYLQAQLVRESSMLALNDIFFFCGGAYLALLPLLFWCKPKKREAENSPLAIE